MKYPIAIVGGGAAALAFIYRYIQSSDGNDAMPRTIYVFEKRPCTGSGAAYEPDVATNLLNTKTAYISPFTDRPGDFYSWLHSNESQWKAHFPAFVPTADSYAPRPLFGLYLQERMGWIISVAASHGLSVTLIPQEVTDVRRSSCHGFEMHTAKGLSIKVDQVVLACGTLNERNEASKQTERSFATPYPIAKLQHRIPKDARVAVIGARLSAIDAVVGLMDAGHKGTISIYSRSGYFPSVRGTQGRITPRFLTTEGLEALTATKGMLTLRDLAALIRSEIAYQSGGEITDVPALLSPPVPPKSIIQYLRQEIEAARSDRIWQAVLYSTNAIIERLWESLQEDEKRVMLEKYMSAFMAYRVSIPIENGKKMLRYLEEGRLEFHTGECLTGMDLMGMPEVRGHGQPRGYDYIVNATGSPRSVGRLDSPLIQNLLAQGMLVPDALGGVKVDPVSYRAIAPDGTPIDGLRVIGELTTGAFFFTSALDINARHASRCIDSICRESLRAESEEQFIDHSTVYPAIQPRTSAVAFD